MNGVTLVIIAGEFESSKAWIVVYCPLFICIKII